MLGKGTKVYGILKNKCPRCHEGDVFPNKNPYQLSKLTKVNDHCDVCGQSFEPEPNFYYGAMYVSYGFNVALFVASFVIGKYILGLETAGVIALLVGVVLILTPYIFRLSRITWLHINVKYKKDELTKND
ncbi:DUF983 domain-containing protein [Phaeocystidibacter luteus]|uniref:DUF983 domain-containing protein n=1 Tax=Phaeocystidibacter luteus TaxID=911197 RepID=A0A6N6RHB4_9FLAO|nr:DUF983 domain-containing protein [Phaeocystidibacter luteus]KAB2813675.1 DUF983 domain-containing protein [Phaeocystidibacter luteus]